MNRLELTPVGANAKSRYKKITSREFHRRHTTHSAPIASPMTTAPEAIKKLERGPRGEKCGLAADFVTYLVRLPWRI